MNTGPWVLSMSGISGHNDADDVFKFQPLRVQVQKPTILTQSKTGIAPYIAKKLRAWILLVLGFFWSCVLQHPCRSGTSGCCTPRCYPYELVSDLWSTTGAVQRLPYQDPSPYIEPYVYQAYLTSFVLGIWDSHVGNY